MKKIFERLLIESKNDYSVIVFSKDGEFRKYKYVHKERGIRDLWNWLVRRSFDVDYMNVYNRRSGEYLGRFEG